MKRTIILLLFSMLTMACSNEDEFDVKNLEKAFTLVITEDDMAADGVSMNKVTANFPIDFSTEEDGKVTFTVYKQPQESIEKEIISTSNNGENIKISELLVSHNKAENIRVRGEITINKTVLFKEQTINFGRAFLDSINIKSSALTISPNSFNEIELTTELIRERGTVSINSIAETKVVDETGTSRGLFNNYKNVSDSMGLIINKFTLGNDTYTGPLYVITTSLNEQNEIKTDSLTLIAQ